MFDSMDTVRELVLIFLFIAAFASTLFPILWSFHPWYSTQVGRLVMLQSAALAVALDATLVFRFWNPSGHPNILFFTNLVIFGAIALASCSLTFLMVKMNFYNKKEN